MIILSLILIFASEVRFDAIEFGVLLAEFLDLLSQSADVLEVVFHGLLHILDDLVDCFAFSFHLLQFCFFVDVLLFEFVYFYDKTVTLEIYKLDSFSKIIPVAYPDVEFLELGVGFLFLSFLLLVGFPSLQFLLSLFPHFCVVLSHLETEIELTFDLFGHAECPGILISELGAEVNL